jgi:PAS domain S-box-containing protein
VQIGHSTEWRPGYAAGKIDVELPVSDHKSSQTGGGVPLAPTERLFQAVVESSPHGVVMVDSAGTIVLVNRETERLFGYSREELLGQSIEALIPQRFREEHRSYRPGFVADPHARWMGTGRDLFGLHKSGQEIPVEVGLNPFEADAGLFVLASVVDLSARRRAEARFRVAVEASPHGMMMVDPDGHIILVNREVERLFGYRRDELLGQPVELLVPAQTRAHHPGLRATFHDKPQRRSMGAGRDLFGRRKDGGEIPVEIGLNPIETDEGLFVLASVVDTGPRRRAEEELRRSNEELERFAYVASHDLQEPLRTVNSYVQLLARRYREQLGGDAADFIDYALGGVARMQHLIEDLLAFSRVGTGAGTPVATSLDAVLHAALENLRAAVEDSGAIVTHGALPEVLADPGQVEQLLTNLLGNALKFRGAETPRVHVAARRDGRHWIVTVADNGIGNDPQYFDRVFVIFQRLHARDTYPGTGVGLAICKKIVERHGGRMWIESRPEAGATFCFSIPTVPE